MKDRDPRETANSTHRKSVSEVYKSSELMTYAKFYLEKGLSIIPLKYGEKTPLKPWKEYQERPPTLDEVKSWFSKPCNIGIVCGSISGNLIVIDFDSEEKFEEFYRKVDSGEPWLRDKLLNTWIVETGKGIHVYFRVNCSKEDFIKLFRTRVRFVEGIDIKAEGGYVVAPPSKHPSGKFYKFRFGPETGTPIETLELNEAKQLLRVLSGEDVEEVGKPKRVGISGRKLSDSDIEEIVKLLREVYVKGVRDYIVLYLTGALRKEGIDYESARKIVELLAEDDEEIDSRLYVLDRTYGLRGNPPKPEEMKGWRGLLEIIEKVVGLEKAVKIVENVRSIVRSEPLGVDVKIKKVSEREELAYQIAMKILNERIIKTFYVRGPDREITIGTYCYENGVYVPCREEIEALVEKIASESSEKVAKRTTKWVVNEVLARIERRTKERLHYEPLVIAFKNVLFDWKVFLRTGSLRKAIRDFSPDIIAFHKIPHTLDLSLIEKVEKLLPSSDVLELSDIEKLANALCPRTLKTFKEWVNEKWLLLFEIIGYTLYPKYDLHKAIMLIGDGSNGKSTYLRLLRDILGSHNVSSVSLQDLSNENNRFSIIQLYHKLANIYPDLPKKPLIDTGRFKGLTGEDLLQADRKHRDPIQFVNYAKLIFSTNELPPVKDMSLAFWRRWLVIEFPNQFPPDPTFYERTFTEEEIRGAIIVGLLAFRSAWLRRKFSFEETEADYKEKWLRETNSVYAFIQDLLQGKLVETLGVKGEKDENSKVETTELYELYVKYCNNEERQALSKRQFTMELERLGFRRVKVSGKYYYKGLKIIVKDREELSLSFS